MKRSLMAIVFIFVLMSFSCAQLPKDTRQASSPQLIPALDSKEVSSLNATQKAWALAASAILTERNGNRHDQLCEVEPTEENILKVKQILNEWWGISSRNELLETLERIEAGGHRQGFEKAGVKISSLSDNQYEAFLSKIQENEEVYHQVISVKKYYKKLGAKGILGWDYSRYISLCRWGYATSYLSEEEAWARIMPIARKLQQKFDSWKELGENYLIGREFWSYSETQKNGKLYLDAYQKLLNGSESCWNRIPWDTPLN